MNPNISIRIFLKLRNVQKFPICTFQKNKEKTSFGKSCDFYVAVILRYGEIFSVYG